MSGASPDAAEVPSEIAAGSYGTVETFRDGKRVLHPTASQWYDVASLMLSDGWNMCLDLTAVDYQAYPVSRRLPAGVTPARFEVVATFISYSRKDRIQARIQVPDVDPVLPSIYNVFPGTDYAEREIYDLFGISFQGHPDLSRILMPETWQGHPLRKDYSIGGIPVQFKATTSKASEQDPYSDESDLS